MLKPVANSIHPALEVIDALHADLCQHPWANETIEMIMGISSNAHCSRSSQAFEHLNHLSSNVNDRKTLIHEVDELHRRLRAHRLAQRFEFG